MAPKKLPREVRDHLDWLGLVQPTGLVVSPTALVQADAILQPGDAAGQQALEAEAEERAFEPGGEAKPWLPDFRRFSEAVLDWDWSGPHFAGTDDHPIPAELEVALPDLELTLRPDLAVREPEPGPDRPAWQLLVQVLPPGQDPDAKERRGKWEASPHARLERLLREKDVPAGLLFNGRVLRLLSAPSGESSGWLDFAVADMLETAGRPICAALRLLLGQQVLLTKPDGQRLPDLLRESRKYQNAVSELLAEQVLHALYELMRGLQAAHDASERKLLAEVLERDPEEVYHALLTTVLRLVFLLYAEERGMLPQDEVFLRHYSLTGLHERLREDAALHPDTMDQRFGAWAQLLVLFRLVHDGAECGELRLPTRHGELFDPDRFPFLEGRGPGARQVGERLDPPRLPDGTIHRALEKLLRLGGERISYRALDVEQIGSVYETMMGFRIEKATGVSVAVKAAKKGGAPATVDLEALLAQAPTKRAKWLQDRAARKFPPKVTKAVKEAAGLEDLHLAIDSQIDRGATPDLVPEGALVLQPSEARRKSGSHYTPRELTEPIVRTTLRPLLERLREEAGGTPRPEQILDLKVCDPAMGSGAFLVETCRQLGDELLEAWAAHDARPDIPPDEDEVLHARRVIAQHCLYGLDRNPVAVDLAKVSLWLATLARDHAFTFVDHVLRHGDALVGLSRQQITAFHWKGGETSFVSPMALDSLKRYRELRARLREAGEEAEDAELRHLWDEAGHELDQARLIGDLVCAAYFDGSKDAERENRLAVHANALREGTARERYAGELAERRRMDPPLAPFHWELEFPEVFDRDNSGFDGFVGNPPFAGKNTIGSGNPDHYLAWLKQLHEGSHGNADLVAHFFRRAFGLLRQGGGFGLIATNTIAQGDTRSSGLGWICENDGEIHEARRRVKWPGQAAVVVSVVHVQRGPLDGPRRLDGREVEQITAFLFHQGGNQDPVRLRANAGQSFVGSYVLGMGFTFDDTDTKGVASSLADMERLIAKDPRNAEVIFPYIGGAEVNDSPTHAHHRYVINFGDRDEDECRRQWPDLMTIVEERVKPERMNNKREVRKRYWWRFGETTPALFRAIAGLERVLVTAQTSNAQSFVFFNVNQVYSHTLLVFPLASFAAFCSLQSRVHQFWAAFLGPTMGDTLRYTPSDCFETFPFPEDWQTHPALEAAGQAYYDFRAELMVETDLGLTKTYNRFHHREEDDPKIVRLRELHAAMDRAVLAAYGWSDISTDCDFFPEHEGEEASKMRYRWPDEVRDEVLARLLELNAQRAAEERAAGGGRSNARRSSASSGDSLF
jgi:hypothetical protein